MIRKLATLGCMAAMTAFAAPASALTVGAASAGNCYPFSCGPTDGVTEWQQVYASSAFPGALSFSAVSFTQFTGYIPGPNMDSATYAVSFYLTSATVTSLSSSLASNEGASLGLLGTFTLGGPQPSVLTLNGANISYDPSLGNLLMDVVISNPTVIYPSYQNFFNADYVQAVTARAWNSTGYGDFGASSGGLQTTFGAVPEASTWAMMLAGFAGLGMVGYRRRKALAA